MASHLPPLASSALATRSRASSSLPIYNLWQNSQLGTATEVMLRRTCGSFMAIKRWPEVQGYCIVRGGRLPWRFSCRASAGRGLLPLKKWRRDPRRKERTRDLQTRGANFSNAWLSVNMQDHPGIKALAHCYPTVSWQTLIVCVAVFFLNAPHLHHGPPPQGLAVKETCSFPSLLTNWCVFFYSHH